MNKIRWYQIVLIISVLINIFFAVDYFKAEKEWVLPDYDDNLRLVKESEVNQKKDQLDKVLGRLDNELAIAKSKVRGLETKNKKLSIEIETLIKGQDKKRLQGIELQNRFLSFKDLETADQEKFLVEVYEYLSPEKNPKIYESIGLTVTEMVNAEKEKVSNEKINKLEAKIEELETKNRKITNLLAKANLENQNLIKNQGLLEGILGQAREQMREYQNSLSEYQEALTDTVGYFDDQFDQKNRQYDSLKTQVNRLNGELKQVSPISLIGFNVRPPNTKTDRAGVYKSRQAKEGIKVSFIMAYNRPMEKESQKLTIKWKLRIKENGGRTGLDKSEKTITVLKNDRYSTVIADGSKFTGQCIVEVFAGSVNIGRKTLNFK